MAEIEELHLVPEGTLLFPGATSFTSAGELKPQAIRQTRSFYFEEDSHLLRKIRYLYIYISIYLYLSNYLYYKGIISSKGPSGEWPVRWDTVHHRKRRQAYPPDDRGSIGKHVSRKVDVEREEISENLFWTDS